MPKGHHNLVLLLPGSLVGAVLFGLLLLDPSGFPSLLPRDIMQECYVIVPFICTAVGKPALCAVAQTPLQCLVLPHFSLENQPLPVILPL